ncbi:hypothetical protein F5Y09DRAFT_310404 [Xylaria sp. FL1042]|nr:hypothetical protein F5Y09DRAFT_310404 [Xylaria sp. FL1042]
MPEAVPTRRPSTGGKPPVRIREHYVVEEAPSHDDRTPCITAWIRVEIVRVPEGWPASDFPVDDTRPEWSIQIYDTTSQSDNRDHLRALAEMLHRETREEREASGREAPDRIDVWGMPLPADMSDEERVARCKAHQQAEIASRDGAANDFPIPPLDSHREWQRGIVIIDRPPARWDEGEGGFLEVHWDVNPAWREMMGPDYKEPEVSWFRFTRSELDRSLMRLRDGVEWLYRRLLERRAVESEACGIEQFFTISL